MKKSNLITGIAFVIVGCVLLVIALLTETRLDGVLFGMGGSCIGPGLMMICKYFYWSSDRNKERYKEKLELEFIEQHDELKERIRDKAGRYAFWLSVLVTSGALWIFSILGVLGVIENQRVFILYLSIYLVFQIVAFIAIFNRIMKKY